MAPATTIRRVAIVTSFGVRHVGVTLPRLRCLDDELDEMLHEDLPRHRGFTGGSWHKRLAKKAALARQDGGT